MRRLTTLHTLGSCKEAHLGPTTHRLSRWSSGKRRPRKLSAARGGLQCLQWPFRREEPNNDTLCPQSELQELPCLITRACLGPTVWEKPRWKWQRSATCQTASTVRRTHGDTSGSSFHSANGLLRDSVPQNWSLECLELLSLCPGTEDQQETAEPAALETAEGMVSLSVPLRFLAEETERSARWRPLRPGTLAGLADRSPVFLCVFLYIKQQKRELWNL